MKILINNFYHFADALEKNTIRLPALMQSSVENQLALKPEIGNLFMIASELNAEIFT